MAATEILSTASSAANSTDLVVAAGTPVTVCLKGATSAKARVQILLKDDVGAYNAVGQLTRASPALSLSSAGTYRFSRAAGATCGVFRA